MHSMLLMGGEYNHEASSTVYNACGRFQKSILIMVAKDHTASMIKQSRD